MIKITPNIMLDESELHFTFVRSPGPGGQNVNKLATAAQLRFDVRHSPSLTETFRARLVKLALNKINQEGELIIKASRFRTQERNKQDALDRLLELLKAAAVVPKKRKKTKPTFSSVQERLVKKKLHARLKSLRRNKPSLDD